MISKFFIYFRYWFNYLFVHNANKISFLRSLGVGIGSGCDILTSISNFGSEPYLIRLGNNVTITGGVIFITHDGSSRVFRDSETRWVNGMGIYGAIDVGDDVFIGVNSIIMPGVKIGSRVIVGAGSLVNKDIPSDCVVAGNPAKTLYSLAEYQDRALAKSIIVKNSIPEERREALINHFWKSM